MMGFLRKMYLMTQDFIPRWFTDKIMDIYYTSSIGESWTINDIERFYKELKIIKEGDLVFDVGANKGLYAKAFERLGAKVIAIEPNRILIPILKKRLTEGIIIEKGVGDRIGKMKFYISESIATSSFSEKFVRIGKKRAGTKYTETKEVDMTTLDELISNYGLPKYCKIDVEGFEKSVLSGLSQKIDVLSFEYHNFMIDEAKSCLERLENLGFTQFNFVYHGNLFSKEWIKKDELLNKIQEAFRSDEIATDIFAK